MGQEGIERYILYNQKTVSWRRDLVAARFKNIDYFSSTLDNILDRFLLVSAVMARL